MIPEYSWNQKEYNKINSTTLEYSWNQRANKKFDLTTLNIHEIDERIYSTECRDLNGLDCLRTKSDNMLPEWEPRGFTNREVWNYKIPLNWEFRGSIYREVEKYHSLIPRLLNTHRVEENMNTRDRLFIRSTFERSIFFRFERA